MYCCQRDNKRAFRAPQASSLNGGVCFTTLLAQATFELLPVEQRRQDKHGFCGGYSCCCLLGRGKNLPPLQIIVIIIIILCRERRKFTERKNKSPLEALNLIQLAATVDYPSFLSSKCRPAKSLGPKPLSLCHFLSINRFLARARELEDKQSSLRSHSCASDTDGLAFLSSGE